MPALPRTTLDEVVSAGREILEAGGGSALTMQAVATRVGIKAPSLYKRVRDRDELLSLVAAATLDDLDGRMAELAMRTGDDPHDVLERLLRAFRAFAHEQPRGYALLFGPLVEQGRVPLPRLQQSVTPVLEVCAALVGRDHALDAARMVVSWANGFVTMELSGAFQLGQDVDDAFEYGLRTLVRAL